MAIQIFKETWRPFPYLFLPPPTPFFSRVSCLAQRSRTNKWFLRERGGPKKTKLQQTHAKPFNLWTHNYSHNGNIIRGDATSSFPKNFLFKKGKNIFLALSLPWWGWDWGTGPENERRNTSIRIQFGGGFIFSFAGHGKIFFFLSGLGWCCL